MSTLSENHQKLNDRGEGLCSVPMWSSGMPDGFCNNPAYSKHKGGTYYIDRFGDRVFLDGSYGGYVPALACISHGGLPKETAINLCSKCKKCIADCDGNPSFGNGLGNDNVFECAAFESLNQTNNHE